MDLIIMFICGFVLGVIFRLYINKKSKININVTISKEEIEKIKKEILETIKNKG